MAVDRFLYTFGGDPEEFSLPTKGCRGQIFRWNEEPTRESFEPVAHTFSEWLEAMLERAESNTGFQ
jgi:hypothetical protein